MGIRSLAIRYLPEFRLNAQRLYRCLPRPLLLEPRLDLISAEDRARGRELAGGGNSACRVRQFASVVRPRVSVLTADILCLLAGLLIGTKPVLFHWLGSLSPWLTTPFFVAAVVLQVGRSNYRNFKRSQDQRHELGGQVQALTAIAINNIHG